MRTWEKRGGGYHSTVERRNPKQPQPPGIFFETLQIMVDNYIITISTGDPWISSTINSITGIMVSPTGSSRTLGGRALCGWLPGAVCWDMFLFQLFIMLENGLEHGGLPPPQKKNTWKIRSLVFYQLITVIIDVFPTIFHGFLWGKTSVFFFPGADLSHELQPLFGVPKWDACIFWSSLLVDGCGETLRHFLSCEL